MPPRGKPLNWPPVSPWQGAWEQSNCDILQLF